MVASSKSRHAKSITCRQCLLDQYCKGPFTPLLNKILEQFNPRIEFAIPGQPLCVEGEANKNFYFIHQGVVKETHIDLSGKEHINSFYLPSELIGFEYFGGEKSHYYLTSVTQVSYCSIPNQLFSSVMTEYPEFQKNMLSVIQRRLSHIKNLASFSAEQRLAFLIVDLMERILCVNQQTFELPFDRTFIASYLGLASETVSRLLTRFQSSGLIALDRRILTVLQLDVLKLLIE